MVEAKASPCQAQGDEAGEGPGRRQGGKAVQVINRE